MRGATSSLTATVASFFWFQPTPLMRGATPSSGARSLALRVSTHAPHARGDVTVQAIQNYEYGFQPTPLMRGATGANREADQGHRVSTHAPHARGDACEHGQAGRREVSTHAPHARGDEVDMMRTNFTMVSTHAPHARGDQQHASISGCVHVVSTHAPHARGDETGGDAHGNGSAFQPTPLMRGATPLPAAGRQPT